jgi:hypothetical protein
LGLGWAWAGSSIKDEQAARPQRRKRVGLRVVFKGKNYLGVSAQPARCVD